MSRRHCETRDNTSAPCTQLTPGTDIYIYIYMYNGFDNTDVNFSNYLSLHSQSFSFVNMSPNYKVESFLILESLSDKQLLLDC